jgi:hypothetical protein
MNKELSHEEKMRIQRAIQHHDYVEQVKKDEKWYLDRIKSKNK